MSLATRCTNCGTVFRVVQDQLKVSEGWVRCGRCAEVFNALEGLFDLESASGSMGLPRGPSQPPAMPPIPPIPPTPPAATGVDIEIGDDMPIEVTQDAPEFEPPPEPEDEAPAPPAYDDSFEHQPAYEPASEARAEPQLDPEAAADTHSGSDSGFLLSGPRSSQYPLDPLVDSVVPDSALSGSGFHASQPSASFLRHAAQSAQWQRPRVRRALTALAGLLGVIFAVQMALHHRDSLAVRSPASASVLSALCSLFGCTLQAPRSLEAVAVESSGLTRIDGAPLYRLQVALRNRAATPVLSPSLDLTLTDVRGETIARRVLGPADFGTAAPFELAPGADWPINAVLDVGDVRVAGYNVELFYP
jgi:predicted Zn finger-like uncharacterized protein